MKKTNNTYVYIRSKDHCWVPAIQLEVVGQRAVVVRPKFKTEQQMLQCGTRGGSQKFHPEENVDLSEYPNAVLPMQNVDGNGNLEDYPDMVALPFMHEAALLYNLKKRHTTEKPYTRTGDIVIAVNPYRWLTDLYTEKKRIYYSNRLVWDHSEADPRAGMEPHVYEVSALSYKGLTSDGQDQSILVSGESGAGKTETVKICLNHIASTQRGPVHNSHSDRNDPVVQRIVDSNPLLEAFGNAKTRRNDNSSRFGKYLQLQFDMRNRGSIDTTSHCGLVGSKCEVYLLEKNRVVKHEPAERTFHIFYQLLASSDRQKTRFWNKLGGTDYSSFAYVGNTDCDTIEGKHDADSFADTLRALELVGVKGDRLDMLIKAICVVLQLGNLGFGSDRGDTDKSAVTTGKELADLADLMRVTETDLTQAFTQRTFSANSETHMVPLNAEAAKDACDALAKEIYQKIFLWLVNAINEATAQEDIDDSHIGLIGLLDIFGFESFQINRFEQLCINYANEKLQQKFTQDVFRSVQQEYYDEGIPLKEIYYDDNTDVLDLIEGRTGLLALLNEECVRPKGNDFDFVQKALKANQDNQCLAIHRTDRMSFGIKHYAGSVVYDAEFFVSRNQDTLPTDLQACAEKCSNDIVRSERSEPSVSKNKEQANSSRNQHTIQQSNIAAPTVWTKYRNQLTDLMKMLHTTRSRYIRCIKPNSQKAPLIIEHEPVIEQLRCAGVVAGITITRSVFPNSLGNSVVLARYSGLYDPKCPSKRTSSMTSQQQRAEDCKALMKAALRSKQTQRLDGELVDAFVVGKTKTYFRAGALEWLEMNRLSDLDAHVIIIQRAARGWLARNSGLSPRKRQQLENEERRRREMEDEERRQKARKQAAARKKEQESALVELRKQVFDLKERMMKNDRETKAQLASLANRAERAKQDNARFVETMGDLEMLRAQKDAECLKAYDKLRLEQNKTVIESLKKEHKKVLKEREKIKGKFGTVRGNISKLEDSNASMGDSYDNLTVETREVDQINEDAVYLLNKAKKDNVSLKRECLAKQEAYMTQMETRLEYQKTIARILTMIQDRSRDQDLMEETVLPALESEASAKSIMIALEHETEPYLIGSDVSESENACY